MRRLQNIDILLNVHWEDTFVIRNIFTHWKLKLVAPRNTGLVPCVGVVLSNKERKKVRKRKRPYLAVDCNGLAMTYWIYTRTFIISHSNIIMFHGCILRPASIKAERRGYYVLKLAGYFH